MHLLSAQRPECLEKIWVVVFPKTFLPVSLGPHIQISVDLNHLENLPDQAYALIITQRVFHEVVRMLTFRGVAQVSRLMGLVAALGFFGLFIASSRSAQAASSSPSSSGGLVFSPNASSSPQFSRKDPDYGSVLLGQAETISGPVCLVAPEGFHTTVLSVGVTGSSEFFVSSTNCIGLNLSAGQCCTLAVTFRPTAVGFQEALFTATTDPATVPSGNFTGTGVTFGATPPPIAGYTAPSVSVSSTGTSIYATQTTGTVIPLSVAGAPVNTYAPYCASCGQPVNLASGTMWHQITDFRVPGRTAATDLVFQRTYLSQPVIGFGDLGQGWMHNWETQLLNVSSDPNTNVIWIDPSGGAWAFTRNADGKTFQSPPGFFGALVDLSDHYELRKTHGIVLSFGKDVLGIPTGRLMSISEPHGEKITLAYDSNGYLSTVSSPFAGSIVFTRRTSDQRVTAVTRSRDHLTYTFTYNDSIRLASSSDFKNNTTTYSYLSDPSDTDLDGLLQVIADPIQRQITFNYTNDGLVSSQTEPGTAKRSFTYLADSSGAKSTQVNDIDGSSTLYKFDSQLRTVETDYVDGAKTFTQWNSQNQVAQSIDELGAKTVFGYDSHGNPTSIQRPEDPAPVQITYNQAFDVPTQITPLTGAPTQFVVDPATGNVTQVSRGSSAQTLSLLLGYDSFGNLLSRNNGRGTYSDQADANGLRTLVFDARNPETRGYDSRGRVVKRSFKSGRVLSYTYNDFDQITRIDDTLGPSVLKQFDIVHRLTLQTVQSQDGTLVENTQYTWDDRDRLILIVDALGKNTHRYYDQVNSDGSTRIIDQPTKIVDAEGHELFFVFDSRLRLAQKTDANQGVTQFGYNARGDLTSVTDPSNNLTTFDFDGNRRLIKRTRASLAKSAHGQMAPALEVSVYAYDPSGKLLSRQDISVRDASGGRKMAWAYDPFDRLIEKSESKTLNGKTTIQDDSKYSYQPQLDVKLLASANNENELLSFQSEAVPPFALTGYSVKAADQENPLVLIQDTYTITPAVTAPIGVLHSGQEGDLLSESYDPAGRLEKLVGHLGQESLTSTIAFDGLFRRRSIVDATSGWGGGSLVGSFSYDLLNRQTSVYWDGNRDEFFNGHFSENLSYDAASNITQNTRELGTFKYGYDPINELTQVTFAKRDRDHDRDWDRDRSDGGDWARDLNRSWKYDLTGNRAQDSLRGAGDFIANGIVSDKIDEFTSDPDGFGNVVGIESRRSGISERLGYRADGKLTSFEAGLGDGDRDRDHGRDWFLDNSNRFKTRYFFDALGRRIAKQHGFVDDHDHSQCDLKHGVHHHDHYLTISYSYLADQDKILLAKDAGGEISLYIDGQGIDDHLGEIRHHRARGYVKDHLGSVMNSAASGGVALYGAFGEMVGFRPTLALASEPALYGFTGRQLDPESGLYYMRARVFMPSIGRFLSQDPIGLRGGMNLYEYARNNPLSFIDPSGLCGFGFAGGASGDIGFLNNGAAGQVSGGYGYFSGGGLGGYASYGVYAGSSQYGGTGYPGTSATIFSPGSASAGVGFFYTNANTVGDLYGSFNTGNVSIPLGQFGGVNISYGSSGDTYIVSATYSPSWATVGYGASSYQTDTVTSEDSSYSIGNQFNAAPSAPSLGVSTDFSSGSE
jgi:RHS repeat-associated protein